MTVESTISKVVGKCNGVATSFSFSPMVLPSSSADLKVVHVDANGNETPLTEGVGPTNYAVRVSKYPGTGSIDYPADKVTPGADGEKLVMKRVLEIEQTVNLENQGGYFLEVQEAVFDRLTMTALQQQEEINRSLRVTLADDTVYDLTIPASATRASKVLGFDAEGNAKVYSPSSAVTDASSVTFIRDEDGAKATTLYELILAGAATPQMFGAVGDGTTDDTAAFQDAIDAVSAAGGGVVAVPPAIYNASGIILHSNVTLRGAGAASRINNSHATNNTIIGDGANETGGRLKHAGIEDLWLTSDGGTGHGIVFDDFQFCRIIRSAVQYHGGDGVRLVRSAQPTADDTVIDKLYSSDNGGYGLRAGTATNGSDGVNILTLRDHMMYRNGSGAYWICGSSVSIFAGSDTGGGVLEYPRNVKLYGTHIERSDTTSYPLLTAQGTSIAGRSVTLDGLLLSERCTASGTREMLKITNCNGVVVRGGKAEGNSAVNFTVLDVDANSTGVWSDMQVLDNDGAGTITEDDIAAPAKFPVLRIVSSTHGYRHWRNRPAAQVYNSANQGPFGAGTNNLSWDTVIHDVGGDFEGGANFVAPVDGFYDIDCKVQVSPVSTAATSLELQVSTTASGNIVDNFDPSKFTGAMGNLPLHASRLAVWMNAGDVATAKLAVGSGGSGYYVLGNQHRSVFTVRLAN